MTNVKILGVAALIAMGLSLAPQSAAAESNVLFIFDASGSMKAKVGPTDTRLSAAKRVFTDTINSLPAGTRLGLMLYGHRRAKDCSDIELVSPLGADDAATIAKHVAGVDAKGETPIAEALRQAARNFAAFKGQSNRIVLITDGIEECKGDPCAAAQAIKASGLDLKIDIVGFTLNAAQGKAIQCVTQTTGGSYYSAADAKGLTAALAEVKQQVAQAAPPPAPAPVAAPAPAPAPAAPAKAGEHLYGDPIHGGDAFDSAVALPTNKLFHLDRDLPQGKQDFFSVAVKGGQKLQITLIGGNASGIGAEIDDPQHNKLTSAWSWARQKSAINVEFAYGQDATVYVALTAQYGAVGSDAQFQADITNEYDANTNRDAGSDDSSAIPVGMFIYPHNYIGGPDASDEYKFTAEAGKVYQFKARPENDSVSMHLTAVDADGVNLGDAGSPNAGAVVKLENLKLAKTGTVYVKVTMPYGGSGDYSFVVGTGEVESPPKPPAR